MLAATQEWFADAAAVGRLQLRARAGSFDGGLTGEDWAQLAVTGVVWLVLPLAVGLWLVMRSEVK